jgi:hypothetical protein
MSSFVKLAKTPVILLFVVSAILNGFATLVSVYQDVDKTPSIAGAWSLNTSLSDDPAKVMADRQGERRRGGGGRMPGGMGGMGGGGRGGGMGDGGGDLEQMQEMREVMNKAIEAPVRLTITQADGDVTFTDVDGRSKTFAANNKKEKHQFENRTVDTKTRWDDGRLVRETSLGDGMKLTETFSVAGESRQLQVIVKLESSRMPGPVTLKRVYDDRSAR